MDQLGYAFLLALMAIICNFSGHSLGSSSHYLKVFYCNKILKFLEPQHLLMTQT